MYINFNVIVNYILDVLLNLILHKNILFLKFISISIRRVKNKCLKLIEIYNVCIKSRPNYLELNKHSYKLCLFQ